MHVFIIILIILCFSCLYRAGRGPTIPDRMVAVDIMAMLVGGLCALHSIYTGRGFLMDIALAWIFLGFVGTLALAKYLSGESLDE